MSTKITPRREWSQAIARQVLIEHYNLHRKEGNQGTAGAIMFALEEIERVWRKIEARTAPGVSESSGCSTR